MTNKSLRNDNINWTIFALFCFCTEEKTVGRLNHSFEMKEELQCVSGSSCSQSQTTSGIRLSVLGTTSAETLINGSVSDGDTMACT